MVDAKIALPRGTIPLPQMELFPLIGATFRTFGRAVVPFVLLGLLVEAPNLAFVASGEKFFTALWGIAFGGQLLLQYIAAPMIAVMAVRLLLGAPLTLGGAFREGLSRSLPNLGAMLLSAVVILAGFILLIVPGMIASIVLTVVTPACVLEKLGPVASMKRSADLTADHRWHIFGLFLVFFLPNVILSLGPKGLMTWAGHPGAADWVDHILQVFGMPLGAIFTVAIYLALVRKKEPAGIADAGVREAFE